MVKSFVKISALIILLSFIHSCDNSTSLYLLTDEMRNSIPFVSLEKAFYIQGSDTIILQADFRVNRQYRYNCGKGTKKYCIKEINRIFFMSDSAYSINLSMSNRDGSGSPNFIVEWSQGGRYQDSGKAWFDLPLSPSNLKEGQFFLEKLTVAGNLYNEIYCDSLVSPVDSDEYIVKTIYYCKEAGIVRVDLKTGEIVELDRIDW